MFLSQQSHNFMMLVLPWIGHGRKGWHWAFTGLRVMGTWSRRVCSFLGFAQPWQHWLWPMETFVQTRSRHPLVCPTSLSFSKDAPLSPEVSGLCLAAPTLKMAQDFIGAETLHCSPWKKILVLHGLSWSFRHIFTVWKSFKSSLKFEF